MPEPNFDAPVIPSLSSRRSAWNIYTVLLLISFLALVVTMLILYLGEIKPYGGFGVVGGPQTAAIHPVGKLVASLV